MKDLTITTVINEGDKVVVAYFWPLIKEVGFYSYREDCSETDYSDKYRVATFKLKTLNPLPYDTI